MRRTTVWTPVIAALCYVTWVQAAALSPVGRWTTIDEKTGEKRADVQMELVHGVLSGTIIRTYSKPGETGVCSACPGQFKDQPIQGLRFIWGLTEDEQGMWKAGKILDPQTGKIYHLKMTREGDKLHVRGYIGIALLGRTQTWVPSK